MFVLYFSEVKLFVHAIAKWTKKAIQIVPEYSVRTHKTKPRGIAPIVSSSPLGICVAEYNAVLTKIEGQTPSEDTSGKNKIPRNKNSYPSKYKNQPKRLIKSVFFVQTFVRICG